MKNESLKVLFSKERCSGGNATKIKKGSDCTSRDRRQLNTDGLDAPSKSLTLNLSISCPPTEVMTSSDNTDEGSDTRPEERYSNLSVSCDDSNNERSRKNDSFSTYRSGASLSFTQRIEAAFGTTPSSKGSQFSISRRFSFLSSSKVEHKQTKKKLHEDYENLMNEVVDGETYYDARRRHRTSISLSALSSNELVLKKCRSMYSKSLNDSNSGKDDTILENEVVHRTASFKEHKTVWGYDSSRSLQQTDIYCEARMERLQEAISKSRGRFDSCVDHSVSLSNDSRSPSHLHQDSAVSSILDSPQALASKQIGNYSLRIEHVRNRRSLNSFKVLNHPIPVILSPIHIGPHPKHFEEDGIRVTRSPSKIRSKVMFHPPLAKNANKRIDSKTTDSKDNFAINIPYAPLFNERTSKYEFLEEFFMEEPVKIHLASKRAKSGQIRDDGLLGFGFSKLYKARDKETGNIYLAKIFEKTLLKSVDEQIQRKAIESIKFEREILESLRCPFLMSSLSCMQDDKNIYAVLDFTAGHSLATCLDKEGRLSEAATVFLTAEVAVAIGHLHSNEIIHRAISPEAILIDGDGNVKLTDFSIAKGNVSSTVDSCATICGMDPYSAPEVQFGVGMYGLVADWWSLGIVAYEVLTGRMPVSTVLQPTLESELNASIAAVPAYISSHFKDLMKCLLDVDPSKRIGRTLEEVKKHPYFGHVDWVALVEKQYISPFDPSQYCSDAVEAEPESDILVKDIITAYSKHRS